MWSYQRVVQLSALTSARSRHELVNSHDVHRILIQLSLEHTLYPRPFFPKRFVA
jgi:hypothetical protein